MSFSRLTYKIIILFWLIPFGLNGQNVLSTMGTDFWLLFMDNYDNTANNNRMKVYVSGRDTCQVTLTNPNTNWSVTADVYPNEVTSMAVPFAEGINTSSGVVTNTGFHLVATDTVSVYVSTLGTYNYEVANVYPTVALRNDYMITTYPSDTYGAEFSIVATEDSTWVDIHLTAASNAGHAANSDISVFLENAGKVYQLKTMSVGSFSGTRIISRDCKKIAVFHGDVCVYIPDHPTGGSCDHAVEQAVPVEYWGKRFFVNHSGAVVNDHVLVTALEDATSVIVNGTQLAWLSSGSTYEFEMPINSSKYIKTNKPASVNVFFGSTGNSYGDPSMLTVNPIEQMVRRITFGCFNTYNTQSHYLHAIIKTSDRPYLKLDGERVPTGDFHFLQYDSQYSYIKRLVSAGSHTLSMQIGSGFNAIAYGLGNHESYAYSIGSSMRDLSMSLYVNDILVNEIDNTFTICKKDTMSMYVVSTDSIGAVTWVVDNDTVFYGVTQQYSFSTPGLHHINVTISKAEGYCYGIEKNYLVNVIVKDFDTTMIDTVYCDGSFTWFDETLDSPGEYTHHLDNIFGCDSLLNLNLRASGPVNTYLETHGCDSVIYEGNVYYRRDTVLVAAYQTYLGCDSVVKMVTVVHPSSKNIQRIEITEGDTLLWIDGNEYYMSDSSASYHYTSSAGCDSIVRLYLTVLKAPPPDEAKIWVPNAFTPDEETNNRFFILGENVISVHVYIYTREGLFITDFDGMDNSWDGRHNGTKCKEGSYVYLIEYESMAIPKYKQKIKGTVTLLR